MIARIALALLLLSTLGFAQTAPPVDGAPPPNAAACTAASGTPNVSAEGKYAGCTYHTLAPNQGTETLHCKATTGPEGEAAWECDCAACGHAGDEQPPLVGKPDDWPTRVVGHADQRPRT